MLPILDHFVLQVRRPALASVAAATIVLPVLSNSGFARGPDNIADIAEKVIEEDMFYPVVVIKDKIVGEGNPRLKTIFSELEKHGYTAI